MSRSDNNTARGKPKTSRAAKFAFVVVALIWICLGIWLAVELKEQKSAVSDPESKLDTEALWRLVPVGAAFSLLGCCLWFFLVYEWIIGKVVRRPRAIQGWKYAIIGISTALIIAVIVFYYLAMDWIENWF